MSTEVVELKRRAAERAAESVESGMVVGLGAGSTAAFAVRRISELLREGRLRDILGLPCSTQVEAEARRLGIPLTTLGEHPAVDLTIDGADEVDPELNLIKGGGGALLREKIVAQASRREIIVVDERKLSPALGTHWPVPVEVVPFGWPAQAAYLESLGARPVPRRNPDGALYRAIQYTCIAVPALFGITYHGYLFFLRTPEYVLRAVFNAHAAGFTFSFIYYWWHF